MLQHGLKIILEDINMNIIMKRLFFGFILITSLSMIQAGEVEPVMDSNTPPEQMLQSLNALLKDGSLRDSLCYRLTHKMLVRDAVDSDFLTGEYLCAYDATENILYMVTQSDIVNKIWFVKNAQGSLELYSEKHGKLYWLNESLKKLVSSRESHLGQVVFDIQPAQKVNDGITTYLTPFNVTDEVFEKEPKQQHMSELDRGDMIQRPIENLREGAAYNETQHAKKLIKKPFVVGGIILLAGGIAYKLWKWCKHAKEKKNSYKPVYS